MLVADKVRKGLFMNLEKVNLSELVFKIEKKGRTVETVTELLKNHPN